MSDKLHNTLKHVVRRLRPNNVPNIPSTERIFQTPYSVSSQISQHSSNSRGSPDAWITRSDWYRSDFHAKKNEINNLDEDSLFHFFSLSVTTSASFVPRLNWDYSRLGTTQAKSISNPGLANWFLKLLRGCKYSRLVDDLCKLRECTLK